MAAADQTSTLQNLELRLRTQTAADGNYPADVAQVARGLWLERRAIEVVHDHVVMLATSAAAASRGNVSFDGVLTDVQVRPILVELATHGAQEKSGAARFVAQLSVVVDGEVPGIDGGGASLVLSASVRTRGGGGTLHQRHVRHDDYSIFFFKKDHEKVGGTTE